MFSDISFMDFDAVDIHIEDVFAIITFLRFGGDHRFAHVFMAETGECGGGHREGGKCQGIAVREAGSHGRGSRIDGDGPDVNKFAGPACAIINRALAAEVCLAPSHADAASK